MASSPSFSANAILAHFDEDRDLLADVLEVFMDTCPSMLASIEKAVLQGDAAGLEVAAHSFKGAASNFCLEEAVALATRLECMGGDVTLTDAPSLYNELELAMIRAAPQLRSLLIEMAS